MTTGRSRPPDPSEAGSVEEFVRTLVRLKQWAGEPPLSRLRSLGGQTVTPDGATIDRLPKSTISHVLRQTGKLPRWDFVRAFVAACLRYCDHPAEEIPRELERWRAARTTLAELTAPAPDTTEPPAPQDGEDAAGEAVPGPAGPAADPAAGLLARRVAREEDRARKGLLGGYSIAPVSFGHDGAAGEATDDLHSIGRYFARLRPQRLMVVGESGAGKTVLAIELVLQLVERFMTGGGPLVPVRLNAARWTLGRRFEPWLAEQLAQDFGLADRDAARLVRDRRVLPVVDGLDELDPEPSTGPPRRAIGLLAELNRYSDLSGRRPGAVVVTCRADRHAQLARARTGLGDAARIHLHDLTAEQIGAYLHARWPGGHPCAEHRDGILAALPDAAVHAALATPWRLLLTVTAVESGADPSALLAADPGADPREEAARIAGRLLGSYVPAATELTPRGDHGTPYRPDQVRAWLERLAAHLRLQAARAAAADRPPPGLTAIDLVPHLLWPIGGRRLVLALHAVCCALLAVVAMLAFWLGSAVDDPGGLSDGLSGEEGLTVALMAGWVGIATGLSLSPWPAAAGGRADVPRRQRLAGGL
uniref:NACHT domain-containing protein n=1 Tax=Actinomadura roseirufa TaxID=2094049 RepID=UPI00104142C5